MISNKRMYKKTQAKTFKRNRPAHKPVLGLVAQKAMHPNRVAALLHGENPLTQAIRECDEAREAERALSRAAFAQEMKLNTNKQENEMNDIKTEPAIVMTEQVDQVDAAQVVNHPTPVAAPVDTKTTATLSQTAFDYVREHPHCVRADVIEALFQRGHKRRSVGALLSQFFRQRLIVHDQNQGLTVTRKTYTPMYHKNPRPAKPRMPGSIAPSTPAEPTAPTAPTMPAAPIAAQPRPSLMPPAAQGWTVESVVDKLNIRQARAVYDELRSLLGEAG